MIRRGHQPEQEDDSSSDEEDAFTAMSRKRPKISDTKPTATDEGNKQTKTPGGVDGPSSVSTTSVGGPDPGSTSTTTTTMEGSRKPLTLTSSMKRHHKPSDTRKAKMDALIEELEAEKNKKKKQTHRPNSRHDQLEKKGSHVRPEEEHLTTNIFVGGLSPSVTEEDLSKLFQEFGQLYSVKIMWPRTAEERSRNRNTGFVCFMHRHDAEEAMALNDTDPFNTGRLLMLRWGKNVKKDVRRGTGGLEDGPKSQRQPTSQRQPSNKSNVQDDLPPTVDDGGRRKSPSMPYPNEDRTKMSLADFVQSKPYDESLHGTDAIRIELPRDKNRFHFISSVAQFVSTDGSDLERRLLESESGNEQFKFLTLGNGDDETQRKENLFYRWRIWSFSHGDGVWNWKTEPFVMFHPNGRYWVPPPLDEDAAMNERILAREREEQQRHEKRAFQTGRQLERAKRTGRRSNASTLSEDDVRRFHKLISNLSISRERICEAMVFCFERSMAANSISELLKDALLDDSQSVTIDMKIARLYLLSDVLYNSQQPGVKNAFQYRTAIESMSPTIFRGLGAYRNSSYIGRITVNKLRKAISAVLGAWTDWGVFSPAYLDDLEGYFEGREPKAEKETPTADPSDEAEQTPNEEAPMPECDLNVSVSRTAPGDWVDLPIETSSKKRKNPLPKQSQERSGDDEPSEHSMDDVDGQPLENSDDENINGTLNNADDDDLDGQDLDQGDLDGEEIDDIDGDELDGEELEGEDLGE